MMPSKNIDRWNETMKVLDDYYNKEDIIKTYIEDLGKIFYDSKILQQDIRFGDAISRDERLKNVSKCNTLIFASDIKRHYLETPPCPKLLKAPFVCNPCQKRHLHCTYHKQLHHAKKAQHAYESLLSEAREGIPLNKDAFYTMDAAVSDGIKRGQHLYHILQTNDLGVSKSTVYRHLRRGYLSVNALDFPRVVKFKLRRPGKSKSIPKAVKASRTYDDFLSYIQENAISSWVEMDTVIGRVGGKAILTLDFTFCNFMSALLLEDKTAAQTAEMIRLLKTAFVVHSVRFGDILPLILTDNGGEFANVSAFECTLDGERESALYFCDPYQSSQKPRVEKNHTLFRDIVLQGESFDAFNQHTANIIFSHVTNVKRKTSTVKRPARCSTSLTARRLQRFSAFNLSQRIK